MSDAPHIGATPLDLLHERVRDDPTWATDEILNQSARIEALEKQAACRHTHGKTQDGAVICMTCGFVLRGRPNGRAIPSRGLMERIWLEAEVEKWKRTAYTEKVEADARLAELEAELEGANGSLAIWKARVDELRDENERLVRRMPSGPETR